MDELRLFNSRAILKLRQSGLLPGAIYLTRPQKVAIIAGTTIVGMYLITEWIEDEFAVFP